MNRKQRIIISITGIILVSLILIGLTYAYFLTKITGNTNSKSISVSTANLILEYGENTNVVQGISNAEPGYSVEKIFTATNKGNSSVTYGAALEDIVNELSRQEDLVYTLTCTSYLKDDFSLSSDGTITGTVDGTCNGVTTEKQFPSTSTLSIMTTNTIDTTHTQAYKLTITYKEMGVDQSEDMGKTFSAKVNIKNPSDYADDLNPFNSNKKTLAYNILNNAITASGTKTVLGSEVTTFTSVSGANDRLLNNAPDDYGTSYYYYGAVTDNYVSFADKLWRIVRINGDGTIRLVLDDVAKDTSGNVIKTEFNNYDSSSSLAYNESSNKYLLLNSTKYFMPSTLNGDNAFVGYMFGTSGSATYDDTHKNINDSTIKTKLDAWYKTNIVDTNNTDHVADALFCNDKTLASSGIGGVSTQLGYEKNQTYYASVERLQYSIGTTEITTSKPIFKCAESATNDYSRFTVSVNTQLNGNKTNGKLTYPVGLLSADEVTFAGAYKYGQANKTYYLYNSNISSSWWTITPYGGNIGGWFKQFAFNSITGTLNNYVIYDAEAYTIQLTIRPVINLKSNITITKGDGTENNPYVILIN